MYSYSVGIQTVIKMAPVFPSLLSETQAVSTSGLGGLLTASK